MVFYDYDEISYLTEVNFRHIPEAMYPEQDGAQKAMDAMADFLLGKTTIDKSGKLY